MIEDVGAPPVVACAQNDIYAIVQKTHVILDGPVKPFAVGRSPLSVAGLRSGSEHLRGRPRDHIEDTAVFQVPVPPRAKDVVLALCVAGISDKIVS